MTSGDDRGDDDRTVVLGVVVAPGLASELTAGIAADLEDDLRQRYGTVEWRTELVEDRLVLPPASSTELFDAARSKLLAGDWDLGLVVTDLPLRIGGTLVARHASRTHGIGLVSLPALGPLQLRSRLRRTLVELVGELVGDDERRERDDPDTQRVLAELAGEVDLRTGALFVPVVVLRNLRLLAGMVRANRPWRLAARLYRVLVAAVAACAFGLVESDVWRSADAMSWPRLTVISIASIVFTAVVLIGAHGLWERAPDPRVREQVVLFNVTTAATVAIGIVVLYALLFGLVFLGAELVITPHLFADVLGQPVGADDYLRLAWLVSSIGTIAGGLGAALESDAAVREAAYAATSSTEWADQTSSTKSNRA